MGAAGYVTIYDYNEVVEEYTQLYPNNNIHQDWWYLNTIVGCLDGKKYIFDYSDDQGYNEGTDNDFWFRDYEAQQRCLTTLRRIRQVECVEVWT